MTALVHPAHRGSIVLEDGEVIARNEHPGAQFTLRIRAPSIAARCQPGAFVHLRCEPPLPMRRPMSVMRVDTTAGTVDMLFKVHGIGTRALADRRIGDTLSILGPIGQSFKLTEYRKRPLLIGGGVGIPPMIYLAEHMRAHTGIHPLVFMGSEVPFPFSLRPSRIMVPGIPPSVIAAMPLMEDWLIPSRLASLQDFAGCYGGYVTDLAAQWIVDSGVARDDVEIFACGPTPMLKAVQQLAKRFELPAWLSVEEYMACAVGGCAGCTVQINTALGPAMKRVCVDGPVFDAAILVFN